MRNHGGSRAVTIDDVAKTAGVSRAAVSKVIRNAYGVSPAMRERVGAAIQHLGYRPSVAARAMRGSSYRLGIEIPHIGARFMAQIVEGAKSALAGTPYQLIVAAADGPEYGAIESLADGLVDGIVAISPLVEEEWLEDLALRVPIVMLGRHDSPTCYDSVVGDDESGARQVMDHLFGLGHRRIAHVTEPESVTDRSPGTPHAVRLRVYGQMMADAGLGSSGQVARSDHTSDGTQRAVRHVMAAESPPTAIFAGHDDIALQVLAALAEMGYRRHEVSVAGYDNTDLAAHPLISLTSVDQSGEELGAQAARFLLERIAGRTESRRHVVNPTLVPRSSTAPIPALEHR